MKLRLKISTAPRRVYFIARTFDRTTPFPFAIKYNTETKIMDYADEQYLHNWKCLRYYSQIEHLKRKIQKEYK